MSIGKTGVRTAIDWNTHGADRALSGAGFQVLGDSRRAGPLPTDRFLIPGTRVDFGGGEVAAMTSSGLSQFKELLIATYTRERQILADIKKARLQHAISWTVRALRVRLENHGCAFRRRRLPPMATRIMAWETSMRRS
jgi:hypothetical protein